MSWGLLIILSIPSIIHLFKFSAYRSDIIIQAAITFGFLFLGWRVFKMGGCLFRITGLIMVLLGLAAYYYLIIQPFFTGQITTFGLLNRF